MDSADNASLPPLPAASGGVVSRRQLFGRLAGGARVTQISAPAGSGKTYLLRSWVRDAGLVECTAWVSVQGEESDPQRFWISVADALRQTAAGSVLVQPLTAAPDLDGWTIVERLLGDLAPLEEPLWLVVDDLHQLRSPDAISQFELLLMRAPPRLRVILSTRRDMRLGLHRLRLEGGLTELRGADLRFDTDEARELFDTAGVRLSEAALARLVARTEGWAAGLRLVALSLAGHPDPDRFAAEFTGTERTVAEYLIAEVLDRQPADVRRLLVRTSLLERVSGPLANHLTGGRDAERVLHELEEANAFVTAVDARRSWFRYHQLFAELLQLELRNAGSGEVPRLHAAAAHWYAEHGYPLDAARHAQGAADWALAGRLLSDHWVSFVLGGQGATAHELLVGFPAHAVAADPELSALGAADELSLASVDEAERRLGLAAQAAASVPEDRRLHFQAMLAVVGLWVARQRGDLPAAVEEAERLLAVVEDRDAAQPGVGDDLRALAMVSLGVAERFAYRLEEAERHLSQGVTLARRAGRPYLEVDALAAWSMLATIASSPDDTGLAIEAVQLAERHGWDGQPAVAVAYLTLGAKALRLGRLDEVEPWLERAERTLRAEIQPGDAVMLHYLRGLLELACGRNAAALASVEPAVRFAELVVDDHSPATKSRAVLLHALVRLGKTGQAEARIAALDDEERGRGETRCALAALRLAQADPEPATAALAPVLDGSAAMMKPACWTALPYLLEAVARDALGDVAACATALEHALGSADSSGEVLAFLIYPAPALLERHQKGRTAHGSLINVILGLLSGAKPAPRNSRPTPLREQLSDSEARVLRYLPTNLSAPEISAELSVSVNTVRTHMRHLYIKLDAHSRSEAVERARDLGLLAARARKG